jgi:hypothetical protein
VRFADHPGATVSDRTKHFLLFILPPPSPRLSYFAAFKEPPAKLVPYSLRYGRKSSSPAPGEPLLE